MSALHFDVSEHSSPTIVEIVSMKGEGRTVGQIRWKHLEEADFNRLVEALLVRTYTTGGLRAQAIDGRGGDGGIDIDVRVKSTGQLVRVFQLKHFPEGFSGGFRARRAQIRHSFEQAMQESPQVWTLVFPGNPTIAERKSVYALRAARQVRIEIFGIAELDGLLSDHPQVASYFTRDAALEALREVNRSTAVLAQPADLREEVERLRDRLDGRSEYWGTAFSTDSDGTYMETIFAKRDDASEREPLSISLKTSFGPDHDSLRERFVDRITFGGSEAVVLPPEVVLEVAQAGPEWFEGTFAAVEVQLASVGNASSMRARVELIGSEGNSVELSGHTRSIDRGYGGGSVEAVFEGGIELRARFPTHPADGGSITLSFDGTGHSARDVRRALRFHSGLQAGAKLSLKLEGRPSLDVTLAEDPTFGPEALFRELIDDLCTLESHFDVTLQLPPEGVNLTDHLWARVLCRIVRGEPTPMPFVESFNATLNGKPSDALTAMLSDGGAVCVADDSWAIELFGVTLKPGLVHVYTHHAEADDARGLLSALEQGEANGLKLSVSPVDGLPFVIYAPDVLAGEGTDVVRAYPWGLPGIPEHPKFADLPNAVETEVSADS